MMRLPRDQWALYQIYEPLSCAHISLMNIPDFVQTQHCLKIFLSMYLCIFFIILCYRRGQRKAGAESRGGSRDEIKHSVFKGVGRDGRGRGSPGGRQGEFGVGLWGDGWVEVHIKVSYSMFVDGHL